MNLYPTKTRLALLAAVHREGVHRYGDNDSYLDGYRNVTHRMWEAEQAGWVELGDEHPFKRPWRLTDAGRAVLDKAVTP